MYIIVCCFLFGFALLRPCTWSTNFRRRAQPFLNFFFQKLETSRRNGERKRLIGVGKCLIRIQLELEMAALGVVGVGRPNYEGLFIKCVSLYWRRRFALLSTGKTEKPERERDQKGKKRQSNCIH